MKQNAPQILVINCGSSSLKFALIPVGETEPSLSGLAECLYLDDARIIFKTAEGKETESLNGGDHGTALDALIHFLERHGWRDSVVAVGHRVVQGGDLFKASVLIDDSVLKGIEDVSSLAPLHNPGHLIGMRGAIKCFPTLPQVAVFDTAFHQTMPPAAYMYAIPTKFYEDYAIRRYGFHGTSHRFIAGEAVKTLKLDPQNHGIVIAHLGNGASATAVKNGKSVDTTMGLTPLEGLIMGTRSGDIDPAIMYFLNKNAGMSPEEIDNMLNKQSGLLGISGISSDCRTLEEAAAAGDERAKLALDMFVHRLARHIGGLASSLDHLDALIFTGGIGENSVLIRKMTMDRLKTLGVVPDYAANELATRGKSGIISKAGGPIVAVINTNEEWMIANDTAELAGITK
ncbi:acetate/propionate family kinase [Paludibacterium yongneupense]|uniref:acetate/propionate family kinase n=1 Tax=Paludibacterium yongneupense TaxID=400061 RepID=UPI0004177D54|nr:acetate kinase [Paludibacterium yongneupense]